MLIGSFLLSTRVLTDKIFYLDLHILHYANELLVRVRLAFQTLFIPGTCPVLGFVVIVKHKLTTVFYASVLLLKINFVITLSKFAVEWLVVPQPLWPCCNLSSIRGQKIIKKTDINLFSKFYSIAMFRRVSDGITVHFISAVSFVWFTSRSWTSSIF